MRIQHITVDHILGLRKVDLPITRRILVVGAPNAAGKSSLAECLRLALLAESPRVPLRKDYGALVHHGATAGMVEIKTDAGTTTVHITAAGKVTDSAKGRESPAALEYVLDPPRFAALDATNRRAFLLELLGLDLSPDAIKARLIDKGCEEAKVDAVAPLLRAGFEAACKHAQTQTTEARGAWKAVTSESYGAVKAVTWRAPTPPFSGEEAAELLGLDKAIADLEAQQADAQKRLGVAEHDAKQRAQRAQTIAHLREQAKQYAYHADLVARAEKNVEEARRSLLHHQQKAGTKPVDWPSKLICPHCRGEVMDSEDGGSIVPWADPPKVEYDPESAARIPELTKALALEETVLARHRQNQKQADEAAIQLKALEPPEGDAETKPVNPETIRQTAETIRAEIETKRRRQRELQAAQRAIDESDAKTKKARAHHADVLAWDAVAKALSPDGIQAEILAAALGPVNERLAQTADDTAWSPVVIGDDMRITFGERALDLCSESEKWRAHAMLAEAIANLSGLKLMLLDRFDVLDTQGREDALTWLSILVANDEISTAIVLGTLKQRPTLPDVMQVAWIEKGVIVEDREAVAA